MTAGGSSSPLLDVNNERRSRLYLASPDGAADPPQNLFVLSRVLSTFSARQSYRHLSICPAFAGLISERGRKDRQYNNSALNEESRNGGTKQNAKSNQCPGQPGTTQTRHQIRQGLSRSPFETFSLRQRRDHERQILGLSRSQNAQTHFSLSLDPTPQRRRPRQRPDLQPVCRRSQSRRHRSRSNNSGRFRRYRGSLL